MASRGPAMMADRNRRACCPLPTRPRTLSNLKLQRLFQVFMFLFLRFESWYQSLIPETHTAAQSSYCAHHIIPMLPSTPLIGIRRAAYCTHSISLDRQHPSVNTASPSRQDPCPLQRSSGRRRRVSSTASLSRSSRVATRKPGSPAIYSLSPHHRITASPHHRTFRHVCVRLKKIGGRHTIIITVFLLHAAVDAIDQAVSCSGLH